MRLVRTWSGSVVELTRHNFIGWCRGWITWTLRGRPAVPAHDQQPADDVDDPLWPNPVKPWGTKSNRSEGN